MQIGKKIRGYCILVIAWSCVENAEFDVPKQDCESNLMANTSFTELESLFTGETVQIHEDLVIEGFVISSDKAGNFYNTLFVQDAPNNPTAAIQLEIELRESHLFYPVGNKVFIKLKGLFLGKSRETLKLGGTFSSFGTISVGRLPTHKVKQHIFKACDAFNQLSPTTLSIPSLDSVALNTLVKIDSLEIVEQDLGNPFAIEGEDTEYRLKDCAENEMILLNSGFSDFQSEVLPEGNGSVTGILQKDGKQYQLVIRDLEDIDLVNERCPEIITEFTSTNIFISELADPDNHSGARFVELFNAAEEPLDLNKWTLRRYTNDKVEVSSAIDLSGFIVEAQSAFVISPNATEFELVYGFPPDIGVSTNSPADSNGDDNLELVDPFGTIIDVFGIVGEDGSGTNHEFEDGRAIRKLEITEGNPAYTFGEWSIFNDTGDSGTTKLPQNAPEDFAPGQRN
ncbi:DUF5689 domain-containing protein [Flagellimonas sp.]|uniref:DUF5689 domain-containing protein n=1 Tax=Flagellimonas sp. TaxID=2058762 RepID=UPI003B50FCED